MPIYWKTKSILAKIETAYGTDITPTGAANAILATEVTFSPMEGEDISRNLERPTMGASPSLPGAVRSVLTFSVELVGSGTAGTAPGWGPLLRMCAVAEVITAGTSVEYSPVSEGHESGSIYFQIGPTRHVMLGCRGSCIIRVNAQGIPVLVFTITGLFTVPTTQPAVSGDYSAFQVPQVASKANTPEFKIGATSFVLRNFEFDLGCDVQPRLLIGYEAILIVDRSEKLSATVEAVGLATYDPFSAAFAQEAKEVTITHGTAAGKITTIEAPASLQQRLSGYSQEQNILEWPLEFVPQPVAGDDQWKITLT